MQQENANLNPYFRMFALCYVLGNIFSMTLAYFFALRANLGVGVAILLGSAYAAVAKFIQANNRAPNQAEKWRLVWVSLAIAMLFSVAAILSVLLITDGLEGTQDVIALLQEMDAIIGISILIALALQLGALLLMYGWGARKLAEKLIKHTAS